MGSEEIINGKLEVRQNKLETENFPFPIQV